MLNEPHDIEADNDVTPENAAAVLQRKTANVCLRALTDAGVFKMTAEGMQASQRFKKVLENGS
ncbi:galactose-1-phosphate uridylyltransferase [Bacillus amyloliquefaciens]|uniref:galactose-1-phosphate uridylyltransferase n=1 Tax=Bacillus amyloliquefaciens TaxID=1390 RepID=UPI002809BA77|nr:galactose-1-phosphate uridylyltransferase [Bacillus amyloliquefaciens]MDQ8094665.1 galactose-1-phosphate uridylyltransferase [Bacillus amyloliquefaciens]